MLATFSVIALFGLAPTDSATAALKSRDAEVRAALPAQAGEMSPALRLKVEGILTRAIDLETMAKDSLGKTWVAQPKVKRDKFIAAFHNRLKQATRGQLNSYRQAKTEFKPEVENEGRVTVPTVLTADGESTDVAYVMKKEGSSWKIVDIVTDDVSTVENYRSSFNRIVAKEGFDALIERLSKKQSN